MFRKINIVILTLASVIVFTLSLKYILGSFLELQDIVFTWMKSAIYDQDKSLTGATLPALSMVLFSALASGSYILFSSSLSLLFLPKTTSIKEAFQRQFSRFKLAFLPLGATIVFTVLISLLTILFFNFIITLTGVSLGLVVFVTTFITLNIVLFLVLSVFYSFYSLCRV